MPITNENVGLFENQTSAFIMYGFMKRITEVSSLCKKCYMQFCCTKCSFCYSNGKCDEFTSKSKFAKLLSDAVSYIESHPDIIEVVEENIIIKWTDCT